MDSDAVLKQFVESSNLQYNLASNAVLEWYGRTIKGNKKILQFIKYDMNAEYEQVFTKAVECAPFEVKPTHLLTQTIPPENLLELTQSVSLESPTKSSPSSSIQNLNDSVINISFETPPKKEIPDPHPNPPPLTGGRKFQSSSSDDDDEEVEGAESVEEQDEPPAKKTKQDEESEEIRIKFDSYSDLKYLESVGTLRIIKKAKHRGVRSTQVRYVDDASGTPSTLTADFSEKKTKLKISYRQNKNNRDIQFALIIYEHMTKNPTTRRNLMNEFKAEVTPPTEETPTKPTTSSSPPASTTICTPSTGKYVSTFYQSLLNSSQKKKNDAKHNKTSKKTLRF